MALQPIERAKTSVQMARQIDQTADWKADGRADRKGILETRDTRQGVSQSHLVYKDLQSMWQLPSWSRHATPLSHIIQSSSFFQKLIVRQQLPFCEV